MNVSELAQEFDFVDTVKVEWNERGQIDLKMPQHLYDESDDTPVHQHGWGPFCKFYVDTYNFQEVAGVYLFTANHRIVYVGEAVDLHSRIQFGYSNISPKNCFKGGQQTNCRINNAILEVIRNRGQVALWAKEADGRKQLEAALIEECEPPWNFDSPSVRPDTQQQSTRNDDTVSKRPFTNSKSRISQRHSKRGKYVPLYEYLSNADTTSIQLSFEEIEEILDASLPASARKHRVWWNPTGHTHAEGWAELGWTSNPDLDAETVTFEKIP